MEALPIATLAVVAGFVLFCVPIRFVSWHDRQTRGLSLAIGLWSVCVAGVALTTVAIIAGGSNPAASSNWYSLRHLLFGMALITIFWVLQELSGLRQWPLFALIAALVAIRAVLWFTTDLVWTGTVDASGSYVWGPLRAPFGLAIGLLALIVAIRAVRRPWQSQPMRLIATWVLIPAVVLTTLAGSLPDATADFVAVILYALPVIVIQAQLLFESSRTSRRLAQQWQRDKLLADFGTSALEVGKIVPAQGAVDLLAEVMKKRCEYVEDVAGTANSVAAAGPGTSDETIEHFVTPVTARGKTVGRLVVFGTLNADDQLFARSVSFVLSAATSRGLMESEARDHALHNGLTGLPNWLLLKDRLTQILRHRENAKVAVLCLDVIEMRAINDDHGHEVGDAILREIAHRLNDLVDAHATVAHIGADEFLIAQTVDDRSQASLLSTRILAAAHEPVTSNGSMVRFRLRVGIVVVDSETLEIDADRLIRDAEMALMQAKSASSPLATYDQRARDEVVGRRRMVAGLREAIRDDQLFVEYQPIADLSTGRTVGVEGLARWRTPDGQLIPPGAFIPLAEEVGMIMAITRRVFTTALNQLVDWDRQAGMSDVRMSLNLTPRAIGAADLVPWLQEVLGDNDIDPQRLTLELTESALFSAQGDIVAKITQLRDLGLRISLDDFGTGYSTFNRLMELPVSELKIDRVFTQSAGGPHRAIVPGVIRLARDSGLTVVAEGIETREQLTSLRGSGCDLGQGYLFSRPVASTEIPAFTQSSQEKIRALAS